MIKINAKNKVIKWWSASRPRNTTSAGRGRVSPFSSADHSPCSMKIKSLLRVAPVVGQSSAFSPRTANEGSMLNTGRGFESGINRGFIALHT